MTNHYLVKYIIAGCAGIGKTSMAEHYVDGMYANGEGAPTIGVEFYPTDRVVDGKNLKIQIWDTAGQEQFATVVRSYYRIPQCAFICFSINRARTFRKVEDIINEIKECNLGRHVDMILVGTFLDKAVSRIIEKETAQKLADEYNIPYIEISSKTGENVHKCFEMMNKIVCKRIDNNDPDITYIDNNNPFQTPDEFGGYGLTGIGQRTSGCCYSSREPVSELTEVYVDNKGTYSKQ